MTKNFCDICGELADERVNREEHAVANGESRLEYGLDRGECRKQRKIVATVHFSFRDHERGFGGPPDLCRKCAGDLIAGVLATVREKQT